MWDLAGCDHPPQGDEQLAGESDDQDRLADTLDLGAGAIPLGERAFLLEQQKPPGELNQPATNPGIARFGQAFLPPLGAAFITPMVGA